ncbi:MAG TPA: hypothetical protein VEV43_01345 [Actinomycetota bacterium]|nr:hypothetical protein [Actinomycetota bacterium]
MIELGMVGRMARRALLLTPVLVAILWLVDGPKWGLSGAAGVAMTLGNLWLSARILGGVAERQPKLLLPAGLAAFMLGLFLLTMVALALRELDLVYFPVTGFTLIGCHLGLVLWEAAGAYKHTGTETNPLSAADTRS